MTPSGIPAHTLVPLTLLLTAAAALVASLAFRLARDTQRRAGWLGVSAPLLPAARPHLARDGADLTAVVLATILLFAAVLIAQRTRVAQLPLFWEGRVDRAAERLALEHRQPREPRPSRGPGPAPRARQPWWIRLRGHAGR